MNSAFAEPPIDAGKAGYYTETMLEKHYSPAIGHAGKEPVMAGDK